jgi:hypothetical protein
LDNEVITLTTARAPASSSFLSAEKPINLVIRYVRQEVLTSAASFEAAPAAASQEPTSAARSRTGLLPESARLQRVAAINQPKVP